MKYINIAFSKTELEIEPEYISHYANPKSGYTEIRFLIEPTVLKGSMSFADRAEEIIILIAHPVTLSFYDVSRVCTVHTFSEYISQSEPDSKGDYTLVMACKCGHRDEFVMNIYAHLSEQAARDAQEHFDACS